MQQLRRKESGRAPASNQIMPEEFLPSVEWTTNPDTHVLRIHLPGFKKEDLQMVIESSKKLLTVQGKRRMAATGPVRLHQSFEVPKDSDADKITATYEDEYLTVVMPRKPMGGQDSWNNVPFEDKAGKEDPSGKEKKRGQEKTKMPAGRKRREPAEEEEPQEEALDLEWSLLDSLLGKVNRNRKVIAVAVSAFAVGFYVSHKLRSRI